MTMKENAALIFSARTRTNGANIHRAVSLIRGYQFAVQIARDRRCADTRQAMRHARTAETALRKFCEIG